MVQPRINVDKLWRVNNIETKLYYLISYHCIVLDFVVPRLKLYPGTYTDDILNLTIINISPLSYPMNKLMMLGELLTISLVLAGRCWTSNAKTTVESGIPQQTADVQPMLV